MIRALAVIAATVSGVALLVMLFLTLFVVSLGFRANATPDSQAHARRLETPPDAAFHPGRRREVRDFPGGAAAAFTRVKRCIFARPIVLPACGS